MNKHNRSLNRWLKRLAIGFCLILIACEPRPTPVIDTPRPPPTPSAPCLPDISTTRIDQQLEEGEMFIPDQIMLTGTPEHMEVILLREFEERIQIPPIDSFDPFDLELEVEGEPTGAPTAINLYSLQPGTPVLDLMADINAVAELEGLRVIAEPNYLTNLPIGGSGHDGGSGVVGSPLETPPPTPLGQGKALFPKQWAFVGANSIHLHDDANPTERTVREYTGEGVRVVVFDTTPLPDGQYQINWAWKEFPLCVWQPGLRVGTSGADAQPAGAIWKGEHGLFVAGLAQAVAPDASYYLVEVLDNEARGDVYTLVRAMIMFLDLAPEPDLKTVVNLSLGLEAIRNFAMLMEMDGGLALDSLVNNLENNYRINFPADYAYLEQLTSQFPIASLKTAIEYIQQGEVLVVAASGNEGQPDSQAPAAFSEVIGVASSNHVSNASCFSNPGNVAAPSGDGRGSPCEEETPNTCLVKHADCDYAVIGIVAKGPSGPGYAHWTGTSFSTPMVSGLAALILEARPGLSRDDVERVIRCSADGQIGLPDLLPAPDENVPLGAGIINVERALTSCP